MNAYAFKNRFFDFLLFRRRRSADWALPATLGLGVGVAAGVGVGLLVAPRSGIETRRYLRDRAEQARERAREYADRARGEIASKANRASDRLEAVSSEMRERR